MSGIPFQSHSCPFHPSVTRFYAHGTSWADWFWKSWIWSKGGLIGLNSKARGNMWTQLQTNVCLSRPKNNQRLCHKYAAVESETLSVFFIHGDLRLSTTISTCSHSAPSTPKAGRPWPPVIETLGFSFLLVNYDWTVSLLKWNCSSV